MHSVYAPLTRAFSDRGDSRNAQNTRQKRPLRCAPSGCYFSEFKMAIIALSALASWESICVFADAIEENPAAFLSAGPCVPWNSALLIKPWSTESRLAPPDNWLTQ